MGKSRKTITIDSELADLVDKRASFNLSGFVNDCLEQHFADGGASSPKSAALKAELEEVEDKLADLDGKKETLRQKRQRIEEQLDEQQNQEPELLEQAKSNLENVPRDRDNPAIQNWAGKLGVSVDELIEHLPEREHQTDLKSI